jgi:aldose 1-epimerase
VVREVIELRSGNAFAAIDPERGGRLSSLCIGDRELLVGPPDDADRSIRWGCYLMAPWPGRLAHGRFPWEGRTIQVPKTHGRHAIHGLVWNRPWRVEAAEDATATLSCELPRDSWPMGGLVRQVLTLTPDSLRQDATIEAGDAMPAALGWHPWFRRNEGVALRVDATDYLETRGMLPTGRSLAAAGKMDLRGGPLLGRRRIDDTYVGVKSPLVVEWPDLSVRLETSPWLSTVVVYTPWNAVCIEPQSAIPNVLALPPEQARAAGVQMLAAGAAMHGTLMIEWSSSLSSPP